MACVDPYRLCPALTFSAMPCIHALSHGNGVTIGNSAAVSSAVKSSLRGDTASKRLICLFIYDFYRLLSRTCELEFPYLFPRIEQLQRFAGYSQYFQDFRVPFGQGHAKRMPETRHQASESGLFYRTANTTAGRPLHQLPETLHLSARHPEMYGAQGYSRLYSFRSFRSRAHHCGRSSQGFIRECVCKKSK